MRYEASMPEERAERRRAAEARSPILRNLEAVLAEAVAAENVPGASLAIIHHDEIWRAAAGIRRVGSQDAVTVSTRFPTGCFPKAFIATALWQAIERGAVSLDDGLGRFFPDTASGLSDIRMRHLLSHSSGLDTATILDLGNEAVEFSDILAEFAASPRLHPPGALFSYGANGYLVLAAVLEKVTGRRLADILDRDVLGRLGITGAVPREPQDADDIASGHLPSGTGALPVDMESSFPFSRLYRSVWDADGMRADDVAAFGAMLLRQGAGTVQPVLSAESVRMMRTPAVTAAVGSLTGWGYGCGLWDDDNFGFWGVNYGHVAHLRVVPSADLVIALLANKHGDSRLFKSVCTALSLELGGGNITVGRRTAPWNPQDPQLDSRPYCGRYSGGGRLLTVTEQDGGLSLDMVAACDRLFPLMDQLAGALGPWYGRSSRMRLVKGDVAHSFWTAPGHRRIDFIGCETGEPATFASTADGFRLFARLPVAGSGLAGTTARSGEASR